MDVMQCCLAHEGRGRDHLVLLVHMGFVHGSHGKTWLGEDKGGPGNTPTLATAPGLP